MATGDTLAKLLPLGYEPPASNYAQLALENAHPVLAFDQTTQETAIWTEIMPNNYSAATGITVKVWWTAQVTSGNVQFLGSFERMDAGTDLDADSFAATQSSGTTNVPGTGGDPQVQTITFTAGAQVDSVVAGDVFRFRLQRDPATDTAAGDVSILAVEIRET
jgi:hypothetical protein